MNAPTQAGHPRCRSRTRNSFVRSPISTVNGPATAGPSPSSTRPPAHSSPPCPTWARPRRRADRSGRARLARVAREPRRSAPPSCASGLTHDGGQDDLAHILTAEQGKPLAEARGEIASALRSSNGSPRRQARLRRGHPDAPGGQAHPRHQAADRRVGAHHALEFPERDDHAQGGARARRGMHRRAETGGTDAALGSPWPSSPSAPEFRRASSM